MTHTQKLAMFDAIEATLRLLAAKRTKGRMELFMATKEMARTLAVSVPPYSVRKQLREDTLKVGRAS
jgi:hypothetical protein